MLCQITDLALQMLFQSPSSSETWMSERSRVASVYYKAEGAPFLGNHVFLFFKKKIDRVIIPGPVPGSPSVCKDASIKNHHFPMPVLCRPLRFFKASCFNSGGPGIPPGNQAGAGDYVFF